MTTRRNAFGASLLFSAALLFALPHDTEAASAECCLRGSSTAMSQLRGVGQDADEKFFMSKAAPPNLMFVLDTSGSMNNLPIAPNSISMANRGNGCEAAAYDGLITAGNFSMTAPAGTYPPVDMGVDPAAWNGDTGFPDLFKEAKFYRHRGWDADSATSYDTAALACANIPTTAGAKSGVTSRRAQCISCLTSKGYYLDTDNDNDGDDNDDGWGDWENWNSDSHQVFAGKFLNFYPPRFLTARTVLKEVIWDLKEVRFGLTVFGGNEGGALISGMNPPCDKSLDPTDASWTSNRKSRINELNNPNTVNFYQNTPLAETLLNVGQYFTTDSTVFDGWFGSGWTLNEFNNGSLNGQNRSICWGCQVSGVVVVTDGAPSRDNCVPKKIRDQNVTCTGCDQADNDCGGSCPGEGNCVDGKNMLDDVAKWFSEHDLQTKNPSDASASMDGRQRLVLYTVGFGLDHPLLKNAAEVTGGVYYTAKDKESLKASLLAAIADINRRATAFGVSSISTLQTSSAAASAAIPRFVPDQPGMPWRGMLYRFNIENEFVNGCVPGASASTLDKDVDDDGKCTSILFADADGDIVEEDATTGEFLKRGTSNPAKPVWEAGRELTYDNPSYSSADTAARRNPDTRSLWTVVDGNSDGKLDSADAVIEFKAANAATLMPYLNISADVRADPVCTGFANTLGVDASDAVRSTWGESCAKAVIEYFRGRNSLDIDPAKRTNPRPWLLGDIFHSSPVVVEPPAAPEACPFYKSQCLTSLFDTAGDTTTTPATAYRAYVESADGPCGGVACEQRRQLMLVGANDGFLHAFDYGSLASPAKRDPLTNRYAYTNGTGEEVWGFLPPDLLGNLKQSLGKHAYFVDGTAMVRDVWVDADGLSQGDGKRAKGEFHTVAVVGERSGGQHFFALDVTRHASADNPPRPKFLWMWPQPCDQRVAHVGESWSNFVPKPPPIGPVLLDAESTSYPAPFEFKYRIKGDEGWVDKKTKAQERWVVMLNGGYDRSYIRGRGVAMVDVWTGRTLWDAFYTPNATDLRSKLDYPVPAGVSMLDIGSGEPMTSTGEFFDNAFDTAMFGDMGGNLWVARMFVPGIVDSSTGKVANWPIARAFQTEKAAGAVDANRRPITYIAAGTMQASNGYVRAFFGTGDRNAILDTNGGACTVDNIGPCISMGCEVTSEYELKNDDGGGTKIKTKWKEGKIIERKLEAKNCTDSTCESTCDTACYANCTTTACLTSSNTGTVGSTDLEDCLYDCEAACPSTCVTACNHTELKQRLEVKGCPGGTTEGAADLKREVKYVCDMLNGQLNCRLEKLADSNALSDKRIYKVGSVAALPKFRFVGAHVYGGKDDRVFDNQAAATAFDAARLTETGLVDLGTLSTSTASEGQDDGAGWYVSYDTINEKTASAATVITGGANLDRPCVLWNSLSPTGSSGICASTGSQSSRLIQADGITGKATCAVSYQGARYQTSTVITPPVEPTQVMMVANGRVSYGVVSADPGGPPEATITAVDSDLVQSIYTLELTPQEHNCRHVENQSQMCSP